MWDGAKVGAVARKFVRLFNLAVHFDSQERLVLGLSFVSGEFSGLLRPLAASVNSDSAAVV